MSIDDLSDDFLYTYKLFHCDRSGVDAVILDSVRAYRGYVDNVNFTHWLDDGSGGAPRAVKSPEESYTTNKCEEALTRYLSRLR